MILMSVKKIFHPNKVGEHEVIILLSKAISIDVK